MNQVDEAYWNKTDIERLLVIASEAVCRMRQGEAKARLSIELDTIIIRRADQK